MLGDLSNIGLPWGFVGAGVVSTISDRSASYQLTALLE
jgi:hypothetical protein